MLSDDFKLSRLNFEVRFLPAYSLWDNAGALAQRIEGIRPGIQNVTAQPNLIEFRSTPVSLKCRTPIMNVGGKKFAVMSDVEEFSKLAAELMALVTDVLGINQHQRVGARFVFVRSFETAEQAPSSYEAPDFSLYPLPFRSISKRPTECASPASVFGSRTTKQASCIDWPATARPWR